jgi:hypothetical protein
VAPDGYEAAADTMSTRGRTISNAAEDAQGDVEELATTEVGSADFGTAHTEYHADYSASIQQLGEGATAMCTSLMSFAAQLGGAGADYAANDAAASQTVSQSGS